MTLLKLRPDLRAVSKLHKTTHVRTSRIATVDPANRIAVFIQYAGSWVSTTRVVVDKSIYLRPFMFDQIDVCDVRSIIATAFIPG